MNASERAFRLLLRAYPRSFRNEYGREMTVCFRDQHKVAGGIRFWTDVIWDVARSAPAQRLDALHSRQQRNTQPIEGSMKTMSILAVLAGALEILSSMIEIRASGYSSWGGMVAFAGGLALAVAGMALFRRSPKALAIAEGAAAACAFAFIAANAMGIAWRVLGIGFPIALIIYLRLGRGRGSSTPTMA